MQVAGLSQHVLLKSGDTTIAIVAPRNTSTPLPATSATSRAQLPPLLVFPATMTMDELVESAAVTLLDLGATNALLVADDGSPVGLLPVDVVVDHLASPAYLPTQRTFSPLGTETDAMWPGFEQAPLARLVCAATGCGFLNELLEYSADPPTVCANPAPPAHPLMIGRR
ncbi:hypothetical protein ABZ671_27275 [Micromonospora sp. NPDC006766]|uniref:hypothetical protein n=1 Tax=Micromonospora sp. NPDC006766 TaxID=3154778 RepID=UPI0033FC0A0F